MTRIRTLDFLPDIFKTKTNSQFLGATLDQLVNPPVTKKIEGYVGSKFGYGINALDYYVTEPNKTRTDYQLDPGVIFTKPNESVAQDFISYPGILDALKLQGGLTSDNNRLFNSQFYSWDSFTNLDKIINFTQYYWLPEGPPAVTVAAATVFTNNEFVVNDLPNAYEIRPINASVGSLNPTITLIRGGTYRFIVNQDSQFWIQGEPGVTGNSISQPNLSTRLGIEGGVQNNGASQGTITFTVPFKDAQDEYNFPGNNQVGVVSTRPFSEINGARLADIQDIDGVTSLNGLTVMFYNTGVAYETGYVSSYYSETNYDTNDDDIVAPVTITVTNTTTGTNAITCDTNANLVVGQTITFTGTAFGGLTSYSTSGQIYYVTSLIGGNQFTVSTQLNGANVNLTTASGTLVGNINQGMYEQGFYVPVNNYFFTIEYVGDITDPVLRLVPTTLIPTNEKIIPTYGIDYVGLGFFKNTLGVIQRIPYISAPLDTLYYQDSVNPNKVGTIKLIESNLTNTLNVETDILGKKNFSSTNGVVFTNGLKVEFDGDVIPTSYLEGQYYVEGVGTSIKLIKTTDLITPESFAFSTAVPYDTLPYDIGNYDAELFIPVTPDYITIARESINKNAWSRSNRWFHIDVINATANYNNDPTIATTYATPEAKAKRPIIEFYPNLKLFNSGTEGKNAIDFIDTRTLDAFTYVAGQENYYPDVEVYTAYTATINANPIVNAGSFIIGQTYEITSVGTTNFMSIGAASNTVGVVFVATGVGSGNGQAQALSYTTATVSNNDVEGTFKGGQYINDLILNQQSILPDGARVLSVSGLTTLTITIDWPSQTMLSTTTNVSLIANDTINANYILFPGARVVFAVDENESIRDKIYVVNFDTVATGSYPVITLTEAPDGEILINNMLSVMSGANYQGTSFYYDGIDFIQAQQKIDVNQPPLFDVFDENGISFGDKDVYVGSSFIGCKLFNYGLGTGINDSVLGFPLRYSSINNVGDISFDVSLNSDTFTYVSGSSPIDRKVNTGYVYDYDTRTDYVREIGWQTAVAPSTQYQIFSFDYTPNNPPIVLGDNETLEFICECDVPVLSTEDTVWPSLEVYNNNKLLTLNTDYTVIETSTSTTVLVNLTEDVKTVIQVVLLSDEVSSKAYYSIPINLNNNPFNTDITIANIGDIRGQYQSIFNNNPNTTGSVFGANNYRDLGNLVPWGNRIIQNSASLVLPGAFLRKSNHNLFDALLFNSREYIKFKTTLVDTVNKTAYNQTYNPSQVLDDALDQITSTKSQEQSFFWSDMLPNKAPFIINSYTFRNQADTSTFGLSRTYDFATANYYGVLVYLTRKIGGTNYTYQLVKDVDYTVSTTSPSLTITTDLQQNDVITIKEYNQTYGSYIPNTPTKLGLYPATIPAVVSDSAYSTPTYFIVGHDGSYTKLYGDYDPVTNVLIDFRDQALLEFEKRIYNNLKLSETLPIQTYEITPGFFRDTGYSYSEWLQMYSINFLDWIGQNRLDYKTQLYNVANQYTYNYTNSGNDINNLPIEQGYWRGLYLFFFDTTTPNVTPWEMIGYTNEPDWWSDRYGPAPYTSGNEILWADMEKGQDWGTIDPITGQGIIIPRYSRPGLIDILPVDANGNLKKPIDCVVGNYAINLFQRNWKIGDVAPVEFSYRRSSTYPFDFMKLLALMKPAMFFNLGADLDNYKYNIEFNQYLVNNRSHLVPANIEVYGEGTAKTSYINWIVDYEKQLGVNATRNIKQLLENLDVRLIYRIAGYSDKSLLKFFVEKGTPNSRNASLLIPDESYSVLLYDNVPYDKLIYSSIILQLTNRGYSIFGNSQNYAYFKILKPKNTGKMNNIVVQGLTVKVAEDYTDEVVVVPYGTEFGSVQEAAQFMMSYGKYLESQGAKFDLIENGIEINWQQMIAEFMYWSQVGWEVGSIVTVNPGAMQLTINKESQIVQPLTVGQTNFVLNQNLYPIQNKDLNVVREGTSFSVKPLNQGDTVAYGQFNLSNFEHAIVFDNVTLFDDVIYNLITGLRQNRIYTRGTKTAEWNGTVFASGFIYNQDNIVEWNKESKYTKGAIVKYKNKYWTALKLIQANQLFTERDWKETEYDEIQKGLLPNSSTRSYESALYYNVDEANLENDADQLSFSLIGFRPRDYMAFADLTDITQVNVYKNMIKEKGTRAILDSFKGAQLPQGGIDYEIYENWAIKQAEFGGVLNSNFVEFKINENFLTSNPSIMSLTNGQDTLGTQQLIPIYSLFNYARPISNPDVLPTLNEYSTSRLFPDAGYVNFNDVKMSSYFYSTLPSAVNSNGVVVPLENFYVNDYVWLANHLSKWQVMTAIPMCEAIFIRSNPNGTSTITFSENHSLSKNQIFAIINFDSSVDGYYLVNQVINPTQVLVTLTLTNNTKQLSGRGIAVKFISSRVDTPADIQNLPLLNTEFVKNTVWVDENVTGSWAVYRKGINYQYDREFTLTNSQRLGSAVAFTNQSGYLIADDGVGNIHRYTYNALLDEFTLNEIVPTVPLPGFGASISHAQNIFVVARNVNTPSLYIYCINDSQNAGELQLYQSVIAAPGGVTDWGSATAISGDTNWIFVSDYLNNKVNVFKKQYIPTVAGSLVVGQTYQITSIGTTDWTSVGAVENKIGIYFTATGIGSGTGTATQSTYENSTTIDMSAVLTPGDNFGYTITTDYYGDTVVIGSPNIDYDISTQNWGKSFVFVRAVQNYEVSATGTSTSFALAWTPTSESTLFVSVNGTLVADTNYTVAGNIFTYTALANAGDIITVSGNKFTLVQTLTTEETPRIGVEFGSSVTTNNYATEILVGAPFALHSNSTEGAVYRYTNGAKRFGTITGNRAVNVSVSRKILINGYSIDIPVASASDIATLINNTNITNVTATANNDILTISLIQTSLAQNNQKLTVTSTDPTILYELGFDIYTQTQVILCPHQTGSTQFGKVLKMNESNSFLASAPVGTRYAQTTFDFTDDANLDNDTVFDNNATQFIDSFNNAGAVYMFDYLGVYNESLSNIGAYVYAQSVNAQNTDYGSQPQYGLALEYNQNRVMIGTPNYKPDTVDGQVIIYVNETGLPNWSVYRESTPIVDINRIQNSQLFSAETNNTLINLDYMDPLQGKLLGAVQQNINIISNIDPASYNNDFETQSGFVWGSNNVGTIWFDTSNVRFVNYHQNGDVNYNAKYWGTLFPGSDVAVYTFVSSIVPPSQYQGPGTVKDPTLFTVQSVLNASNVVTPVYYFWVRNTNVIYPNKTLSDTIIESYIQNPLNSGIAYMAPLLPNTFALYNSQTFINANDTVFHVGYSTGDKDDPSHSEYTLVRSNFADDFLPGVPKEGDTIAPEGLYDRLLDSLCGVDEEGEIVPNPFLPKAVQSGILARPRQSFFYNRFAALKNYLQYANTILAQFPISELRRSTYLYKQGTYFDTTDYWRFINWWASGYDNNTKAAIQVPIYADLATLNVPVNTIVSVAANSSNLQETYRYDGNGQYTRIGLQNGTIEFKRELWDYSYARLGFGDNFYDTDLYDQYPSEETRWIIRALNEQIYTNELLIYRNKSLILLFDYIQSETLENQNYLPWLNKTSLVDVSHKIRELLPLENFQSDNQDFLAGYLNEAKPYHVVIKDFLFEYIGTDVFEGDITDFDLPSKYNATLQQFVTPQLVYNNPNGDIQYLPNNEIWQEQEYNQWFNNYGVSIIGQDNYMITTTVSYLDTTSTSLVVKNAQGFPINGTIKLDNEIISYSSVDRSLNMLLGLQRGLNDTTVTEHYPNTNVYIDLPAVVLLDGGRDYVEPPKVTAYIDLTKYPAPREPAILEAVMSLDSVTSINVINPGSGYAVLPEILIDPAQKIVFSSNDVNNTFGTLQLYAPTLQTGDLVRYVSSADSVVTENNIGGLLNGQWYYVNVLETTPAVIIAFYSNYSDAINDHDRIMIYSITAGENHTIELGAKASAVSTSYPVRENNITLKFDRTTYTSQITEWTPNTFYAGPYAGGNTTLSSSNVASSTDEILASAENIVLEIEDVQNERMEEWSTFIRTTKSTTSGTNILELDVDITTDNASGSTIGFTVGMPIKFVGNTGASNLTSGTTYYIKDIVSDTEFKISATETGSEFVLGNQTGLLLATTTAKVTNTAILTVNYPGILQVTNTSSTTDELTIPLNSFGTGGTTNFLSTAPVFFTGNVFGGVIENQIYYINNVVSNQNFTISEDSSLSNVFQLTTGTGNMTINVNLPISPGQINGQQFMVYQDPNDFDTDFTKYYFKVDGLYTVKVYSDAEMTVPVSADDFPYPAGNSYAYLPEPFYFNQSIVKYNNRVYACVISNNDDEFVLGKWEELQAGDYRLNAMDRTVGFYQPTVNMPGIDLPQLYSGVTYPNTTYLGNKFQPDEQFELDTLLQAQTFEPTNVNIESIVYNGSKYLAPVNLPNYSGFVTNNYTNNYQVYKLSNSSVLNFTDIIYTGTRYVMTANNSAAPIFTSVNGTVWTTNGFFIPNGLIPYGSDPDVMVKLNQARLSLNSVTYNSGRYIAVGSSIVTSTDGAIWTETYKFPASSLVNTFYSVSYVNTTSFTGYIAVGKGQYLVGTTVTPRDLIATSSDGESWTVLPVTTTKGLYGITNNSSTIVAVGEDGIVATSTDGVVWTNTVHGTDTLRDVIFANSKFVAVGDNGLIRTSTNGTVWTTQTSGTTEDLNSVIYANSTYTVVGDNNTLIQSADAVTFVDNSVFNISEPEYTVQGDAFLSGYGPEELVPGIVKDSMVMKVTTRPGTTWDGTQYGHTGYGVKSIEILGDGTETEFSFAGLVQTPAQVKVSIIDSVSGLGTTIYLLTDYMVDWIDQTIILNTALPAGDYIRIDVYEVGNGNQLVKSSTYSDPILTNTISGFNEILLDANYTATIYQGGGVIRPSTVPVYVTATETTSVNDSIVVTDASKFTVNEQIKFSGAVFGNIVEDAIYYVKSISSVTSSITISETLTLAGVAGPIFALSDDTGVMTVVIDANSASVYTDPIVYHNGNKLILGITNAVVSTKASTNTVVLISTNDIDVNDPITFSDDMIGGITPHTTYYVKTIVDANEITISATPGGATLTLTDGYAPVNGLSFITHDYSFIPDSTQIKTKLVFANQYDSDVDYLVYSILTETQPVQYGYAIPETEMFTGNGSTTVFDLSNYSSNANEDNAIVEVNGLRLLPNQYTINGLTDTITFTAAPTGDIAVTTYNDTNRQYLNTYVEENTANTSGIFVLFDSTITGSSGSTITSTDVSLLINNTPVYFMEGSVPVGSPTSIPEIIAGTKYYLKNVNYGTNTFSVSATYGGTVISLTTTSGLNIKAKQWLQDDVDRIYVTINGQRVPSSELSLQDTNKLVVASPIVVGDDVIITTMIPTSTPNQETYLNLVDTEGNGSVYRANDSTRTYLTEDVFELYDTITVKDISRLTMNVEQTSYAPISISGYRDIPLNVNSNQLLAVTVYNNTSSQTIASENYEIVIESMISILRIYDGAWINTNDLLSIACVEGKYIYVNGEMMAIQNIDIAENTLTVQRGVNGTSVNTTIPENTTVFGLLEQNRMSPINYNEVWNKIPGIYNTTLGDPLQIADSIAATFLKSDNT